MSVTDDELAALLVRESNSWVRSNPNRNSYPFHLLVIKVVSELGLKLGPRANVDTVREAAATIADDDNFRTIAKSEKTLNRLNNRLRAEMVQDAEPDWPRIRTTVCKEKQRDADGRVTGCCSDAEIERGCTVEVGTEYLAATNGVGVIFAGFLTSNKNRRTRRDFAGSELPSLLLFTLLHEFGHILHVAPRTLHVYDDVYLFYTRCARLMDAEVRQRNRVRVGYTDTKEFFASLFAINSINSLNDA